MLEGSPGLPGPALGLTTGLGRPHSNPGDVQEIQSWKPEEQPKLAPGITIGFKLFFSQTAAISLCRAQGVMDMVFIPGLHLTFSPSPPSFYCNRRKSLPLLFKYSHYGFGSSCHSKEYPVISSWEECSASKSRLLATTKRPERWRSLKTLLGQLAVLSGCSRLLEGKSGERSSSSAVPNLLPIPVPSPTTHTWRSCFKQGRA